MAQLLASPLFLPAASSYNDVLTVAQLDKADATCTEADAARPNQGFFHAARRLSISPPSSPTYHFLRRDCAQIFGLSGGEGRDASSTLGSGEAGDGGMDKATRAAIARACEVNRGGVKGESGARKGGEGGGGGGGGWLSGLSAIVPEVPPDVKSGSADRGVPGGSKD
jgi:hypothetical protein